MTLRCLQGEAVDVCHSVNVVVGQERKLPRVRGRRQIPDAVCSGSSLDNLLGLGAEAPSVAGMQPAGGQLRQDALWHNTGWFRVY